MKIIYKTEPPSASLTFGMVKENQFFVMDNCLYQKCSITKANMIANRNGCVYSCDSEEIANDHRIDRILPEIEKIEF